MKNYVSPELEYVVVNITDVIATSYVDEDNDEFENSDDIFSGL